MNCVPSSLWKSRLLVADSYPGGTVSPFWIALNHWNFVNLLFILAKVYVPSAYDGDAFQSPRRLHFFVDDGHTLYGLPASVDLTRRMRFNASSHMIFFKGVSSDVDALFKNNSPRVDRADLESFMTSLPSNYFPFLILKGLDKRPFQFPLLESHFKMEPV